MNGRAVVLLLLAVGTCFSSLHRIRVQEEIAVQTWEIAQHLATKSPYWSLYEPNSVRDTPVPSTCDPIPFHFNYLARHGSREPTTGDIKNFIKLEKNLKKYGPYITNSNFTWMQTWVNPYLPETQGVLTNKGEEEHYNTSKRYLQRFSPLFSSKYQSKKYPIQSTQVERTARSGNAFGFGLFEGTGHLGPTKYEAFFTYSDSVDQDFTLRFFDNCPNYSLEVDDNSNLSVESEAWLNMHIPDIIVRVTKLLAFNGTAWPLTSSDISTLYKACAFEVAAFEEKSFFCSLFTQDDIEMFEYAEDLDNYYIKGYGTPLAYQISCPLLTDFLQTMDDVLNTTILPQEQAYLRFAHAETMLPFVSILGLFNDGYPLFANSSADVRNNRKWRTSQISPFAANVALLFYNCSKQTPQTPYRVKLLHNEQEYQFPGCNEMYCPYDKVKQIYASTTFSNCNFNLLCGIQNQTCPECTNTCAATTDNHPIECGSPSGVTTMTIIVGSIGLAGILILGVTLVIKFCKSKRGYSRVETVWDK